MDPLLPGKMHGAMTHFPIALSLCSVAFDALGVALARRPAARGLHSAGFWTLMLGALGCFPAVVSGLLMTKGEVLGHGALRMHHLFVWPAFALIVALATWRVFADPFSKPRAPVIYATLVVVTAGLMAAAGYWGGEMMIAI